MTNYYDKLSSEINKQECIPVGCVPSAAVAVGRGVCPGGGGVCPGGISQHALGSGVYSSACWDTPPPLWTEFLIHACENITFPQKSGR